LHKKAKQKQHPSQHTNRKKKKKKHQQEKQTLTDNNQWRRKVLINVNAVGFGFFLQDIWVPGQGHGRNLECLINRQQENLFKTTFNIL
jgi:hypothetical protein